MYFSTQLKITLTLLNLPCNQCHNDTQFRKPTSSLKRLAGSRQQLQNGIVVSKQTNTKSIFVRLTKNFVKLRTLPLRNQNSNVIMQILYLRQVVGGVQTPAMTPADTIDPSSELICTTHLHLDDFLVIIYPTVIGNGWDITRYIGMMYW